MKVNYIVNQTGIEAYYINKDVLGDEVMEEQISKPKNKNIIVRHVFKEGNGQSELVESYLIKLVKRYMTNSYHN